jgi:hypothetical protein
MSGKTRVKTHYLRGRGAGHFGRWMGGRSDVIYPIMSDEQRRQRPKGPRPFGLQRKSPPVSSEGSTVWPDTLFTLLLPGERFCLQHGSRK